MWRKNIKFLRSPKILLVLEIRAVTIWMHSCLQNTERVAKCKAIVDFFLHSFQRHVCGHWDASFELFMLQEIRLKDQSSGEILCCWFSIKWMPKIQKTLSEVCCCFGLTFPILSTSSYCQGNWLFTYYLFWIQCEP